MISYVGPNEIMEVMPISKPTAYRIIKKLNNELTEQGYLVVSGKIPRNYFMQRYNLSTEDIEKATQLI